MTETIRSIFDVDTAGLADEGVWLPLRHPATGAPLAVAGGPVRLRLLGIDGARFQEIRREIAARRRQALQAGEAPEAVDAALEVELAARATLDWQGVELAFSTEAARRLYGERRWVLEQVLRFVADRANFLRASGRV
jgi:hypothetical protein